MDELLMREDRNRCSEICLIAPSRILGDKARQIIQKLGDDIQVYEANLDEAAGMAADLISKGARVIISRKGTKILIENALHATVVGIPTVLSDYMDAMKRASCIQGLVAFFSYDDLSDDVRSMCELLNIEHRCYHFTDMQSGVVSVRQALSDGAVLGIGGVVTEKAAASLGLEYVSMENSTESIVGAIESARQILEIQKKQEKQREKLNINLERYRAVVDFTRDGIVAVDAGGIINVVNPAAEKIFGRSRAELMNHKIENIIPGSRLYATLETGQKKLDELVRINASYVTVNAIPIAVDGKRRGAVALLKDVESLQKSERKARMGLYQKELVAKYHFEDIIGTSKSITAVIRRARQYADVNATVLIHGETGTGKELFAQSIHSASGRKHGPFVAINCAALDKNLIESELFGYEEGTFTGALKGGKMGLFELAHGGTIFLDEIGEIPVNIQAQLLRVLQEREVRRIGSPAVIPIDVRVIVATNRNLLEEIRCGNFRQDLYYRLNILNLYVPPLRERERDYVQIASSIFEGRIRESDRGLSRTEFFGILDEVKDYSWPGNVRELSNFVECVNVLCRASRDEVRVYVNQLLNGEACQSSEMEPYPVPASGTEQMRLDGNLKDWEKRIIQEALMRNHLSPGKAAAELGMSRTTLWRKMQEYDILN